MSGPEAAKPADGGSKGGDKGGAKKGLPWGLPPWILLLLFALAIGLGALYAQRQAVEWTVGLIMRLVGAAAIIGIGFAIMKGIIDDGKKKEG